MWRDRTNLYISYRQSYSHHPSKRARHQQTSTFSSHPSDDDRQGLLSPNSLHSDDTVIEMDLLPPRWSDVSDEVNEILARISKHSATLEKLHQKHVLPGFDDNRSKEEEEIEFLTTEITAGFHTCQNKIRRIEKMAQGGTKAEMAMGRNIQVSLASKVQEASTKFRKKQSAYLKKLRGLSGLASPLLDYRSASPAVPDEDVSYSQSAIQQSATLTSNDVAIQQREREITDIARGILELADIFKELQTMVIDQGTMLDRIDYNVEQLNTHVKAAEKEMNIAQGYQKKYTKRKIIFLLVLIIIGMIILVAIKPRSSEKQVVIEKPKEGPVNPADQPVRPAPKKEGEFGIPTGEIPQGAMEGDFGQFEGAGRRRRRSP